MFATISSNEAKSAREAPGLSQAKVASAVYLNRAYLSQFENGIYLLTDNDNEKLRLYYEIELYLT
jgi:transcriptional regulator with XRE-family HTH domain